MSNKLRRNLRKINFAMAPSVKKRINALAKGRRTKTQVIATANAIRRGAIRSTIVKQIKRVQNEISASENMLKVLRPSFKGSLAYREMEIKHEDLIDQMVKLNTKLQHLKPPAMKKKD